MSWKRKKVDFYFAEADLYLSVLEARGKVKKAIDYLRAQPINQMDAIPGTRAARNLERLYFLDGDFDAVVAKSSGRLLEEECVFNCL